MNDWARGDARDGIRATQRAHLWFICQEQRSVQIVATDCHTIHSPPHQTGMQNVQMGHFKPKLHRFSQTQVRYTRPCSNFWVMLRYKVTAKQSNAQQRYHVRLRMRNAHYQ